MRTERTQQDTWRVQQQTQLNRDAAVSEGQPAGGNVTQRELILKAQFWSAQDQKYKRVDIKLARIQRMVGQGAFPSIYDLLEYIMKNELVPSNLWLLNSDILAAKMSPDHGEMQSSKSFAKRGVPVTMSVRSGGERASMGSSRIEQTRLLDVAEDDLLLTINMRLVTHPDPHKFIAPDWFRANEDYEGNPDPLDPPPVPPHGSPPGKRAATDMQLSGDAEVALCGPQCSQSVSGPAREAAWKSSRAQRVRHSDVHRRGGGGGFGRRHLMGLRKRPQVRQMKDTVIFNKDEIYGCALRTIGHSLTVLVCIYNALNITCDGSCWTDLSRICTPVQMLPSPYPQTCNSSVWCDHATTSGNLMERKLGHRLTKCR
jgi:hypothetical protein